MTLEANNCAMKNVSVGCSGKNAAHVGGEYLTHQTLIDI